MKVTFNLQYKDYIISPSKLEDFIVRVNKLGYRVISGEKSENVMLVRIEKIKNDKLK